MKTNILFFIFIFSLLSCENQIYPELPITQERLVIDASINWQKGTLGNEQQIILSLSAPYFDTEVPTANNAQVRVFDSFGNEFVFIEDGMTGIYKTTSFIPEIDRQYNLEIIYQDETYTATETLKSVVNIDRTEQINDGGFTGDETEFKSYFTDPEDQENYYLFSFQSNTQGIPTLEIYKDEFINGNEIFGYYADEDIEQNDELTIKSFGVSRRYYDFMFLLLQQTSEGSGGPFETQPATVRGNCENSTNPNNFAFGYFRCSEVDVTTYTVQ